MTTHISLSIYRTDIISNTQAITYDHHTKGTMDYLEQQRNGKKIKNDNQVVNTNVYSVLTIFNSEQITTNYNQ